MKKRATQKWCEVFLKKLKYLHEPVTFNQLKNLVWDDPEARPLSNGAISRRAKMTTMPVTGSVWGAFCKRYDNISITRKVCENDRYFDTQTSLTQRPSKINHYQWIIEVIE